MATIASSDPIAPSPLLRIGPEQALTALDDVRARTFALIEHLSDEQLDELLSPIMSPLAWDLAHIAAYEDLWLGQRYGGLELLRPDLAELYDAFETPRAVRGEIELLSAGQARAYMAAVRERVGELLLARGVGDGTIYELVLRHELQHSETMRQTMVLAGLLPAGEPPEKLVTSGGSNDDWTQIEAGPFAMGAGAEGFAYDNERPRHTVELPSFQIALYPVSNASWMSFVEQGGYRRAEWWSTEGWNWIQANDITYDVGIERARPDAPVCHVSWFEADAFARANAARLPSEAEWEKAASQQAIAAVGAVWEWTSSHFGGYPGFVAHPYREYSEVFFGENYRVLRGGSWASSPRVATTTFRNWDYPIRRQIFAGLRLARDVS